MLLLSFCIRWEDKIEDVKKLGRIYLFDSVWEWSLYDVVDVFFVLVKDLFFLVFLFKVFVLYGCGKNFKIFVKYLVCSRKDNFVFIYWIVN